MLFGNKNELVSNLKNKINELSEQITRHEINDIKRYRQVDEIKREYQEIIDGILKDNIYNINQYDFKLTKITGECENKLAEKDTEFITKLHKEKEIIRQGFKSEIENLKTSNKKIVQDLADTLGKYEGLLIANKGLVSHNENLNNVIKTVLGKLPDVSANIKSSGDTHVSVNK